MTRSTLLIAALLLIIGLLTGALVTSARSTDWQGTKWEYAQIFSTSVGVTLIFTPDMSEQIKLNNSYDNLPDNLRGVSELMQLAGANGWEFVALTASTDPTVTVTSYYFKRPIP